MEYVALASAEESVNRVRKRAELGGHSAPPDRIREIYEASLKNLPRALSQFDYVAVFDNTDIDIGGGPTLILEAINGRILRRVSPVPTWVASALRGPEHELIDGG